MKKKLKLYYAQLANMGDLLNVLITERVFGYAVDRRSVLDCEMSAIGSGLEQFELHGGSAMRAQQRICGILMPRVHVWGTGFINYPKKDSPFFRRDMRFEAVRGELSRRRVEKLLGKTLDIPTGDGGILADRLVDGAVAKKHRVGIVPHICDLNDPSVSALAAQYEDAIIINVKNEPVKVIKQIASCEAVLSSSLHGLIVADSFNVPNRHVLFSDRPLGDGFKFDDYYSAYNVPHIVTDLRRGGAPSAADIASAWPLDAAVTDAKKRDMFDVFPFPVIGGGDGSR